MWRDFKCFDDRDDSERESRGQILVSLSRDPDKKSLSISIVKGKDIDIQHGRNEWCFRYTAIIICISIGHFLVPFFTPYIWIISWSKSCICCKELVTITDTAPHIHRLSCFQWAAANIATFNIQTDHLGRQNKVTFNRVWIRYLIPYLGCQLEANRLRCFSPKWR